MSLRSFRARVTVTVGARIEANKTRTYEMGKRMWLAPPDARWASASPMNGGGTPLRNFRPRDDLRLGLRLGLFRRHGDGQFLAVAVQGWAYVGEQGGGGQA